jgi:hypothetical protein
MSRYLADRSFAALSLVTTLLLCGCSSPNLAIEANPMPEKQVATYMTSVTPSSAYDTPPKFLKGYAPFFPAMESKRRHWRFAPARKHGQPVVVRMRLPFTFRS